MPSPPAPSTQTHYASPPRKNSSLGMTAQDPSSISFMLSISSVSRPKIPPGNGLRAFFGLVFDYISSGFSFRSFLQIWIPYLLFRALGWARRKVGVSSFSLIPSHSLCVSSCHRAIPPTIPSFAQCMHFSHSD